MAVAVTIDIAGGTAQQHEQVAAEVLPEGKRVGDPPPAVAFFPVHGLIRN